MRRIDRSERGHVLATQDDEVVYCRVVGLGNMNNCAPFQSYSQDMQSRGYHNFVLDFSSCEGLDSTFLGVLVGIAVGQGGAAKERTDVVVINAGRPVRKALGETGIDRLLTVCDDDYPVPSFPMRRLAQPAGDEVDRARMILDAHEDLCRVDPANVDRFGAFIRMLRAELGRTDGECEPPVARRTATRATRVSAEPVPARARDRQRAEHSRRSPRPGTRR